MRFSRSGRRLGMRIGQRKGSKPVSRILSLWQRVQAAAPEIIRTLAAHHVRIPVSTTYLNMVLTLAQQILLVTEGMFPVYASGWLNYEEERGKTWKQPSEWLGDYAMNTYAHCGWIGAHFLCEGLRRLKGHAVTWESFPEAMEERPIMNPLAA